MISLDKKINVVLFITQTLFIYHTEKMHYFTVKIKCVTKDFGNCITMQNKLLLHYYYHVIFIF